MKKIGLVIISMFLVFNLIMPPEVAHANLITKPIAVAAKKAAKDLAKDTAVEMANQIVADFLVRELIEGIQTDDGYSAVCMDGKKNNISDCAPEKQAQIKTNLSTADKANLESKIEAVLESKTGTSSKWAKFLDFFVPIFLVGGAVTFISAAIDGDVLSFFDDIAQQALIDAGYLKPLSYVSPPAGEGDYEKNDFRNIVQSANIELNDKHQIVLTMNFLNTQKFTINYTDSYGQGKAIVFSSSRNEFIFYLNPSSNSTDDGKFVVPTLSVSSSSLGVLRAGGTGPEHNIILWRGAALPTSTANKKHAQELAAMEARNIKNRYFSASGTDVNSVINQYFAGFSVFTNMTDKVKFKIDLPDFNTNPKPPSHTDYGQQTATEKLKDPDGNVQIKGPGAFTFTHGDKEVYPSTKSETGWRDMTTGKDIVVVEDNIVVEERDPSIPPPKPPEEEGTPTDEDPPDKNKNKQELEKESKKLGALVTSRFPFSLPWDFLALVKLLYAEPMTPKWVVKGTDDIPLNFTIDLKFLDPYISWFRGFIMVGFVISVIFMHGRFMGGSK